MANFPFMHKAVNPLETGGRSRVNEDKSVDDELTQYCPSCRRMISLSDLWANANTCSCGYHFRMKPMHRIDSLIDENSFEPFFEEIKSQDPLNFPDYAEKLETTKKVSGRDEAVLCGRARIGGEPCFVFVMDPYFMMGSMGTAVGAKIAGTFEKATEENLPVIGFTVSGGARMQEGLLSLMQMARTSAAVKQHSNAGLFYLSVLTDPTTGGVMASFAMEGDMIFAEPGATAGFAGARVIEQTVRKKLPQGFQTAEFLLEHGFVDAIVPRPDQREIISTLLKMHAKASRESGIWNVSAPEEEHSAATSGASLFGKVKSTLDKRINDAKTTEKRADKEKETDEISPYERVKLVRGNKRPTGLSYIRELFTDFLELHGDRSFADDPAIVGGVAFLRGRPVTVIAMEKGRTAKARVKRNFGMPNPEGYRKALRLMKQAEKFSRPVICFVDTAGAFCGIGAEERGQGQAIAVNLMEMSDLKSPIISILIGEGGSGGALALTVADEVWMLENAVYSVISPEGCASILWKDAAMAAKAADYLKLTAKDAKDLEVADYIISEEAIDKPQYYKELKDRLDNKLTELSQLETAVLTQRRYNRFRKFGG
jgi:acetyl-CoA carboxylase carboxyl transferase subunit beta